MCHFVRYSYYTFRVVALSVGLSCLLHLLLIVLLLLLLLHHMCATCLVFIFLSLYLLLPLSPPLRRKGVILSRQIRMREHPVQRMRNELQIGLLLLLLLMRRSAILCTTSTVQNVWVITPELGRRNFGMVNWDRHRPVSIFETGRLHYDWILSSRWSWSATSPTTSSTTTSRPASSSSSPGSPSSSRQRSSQVRPHPPVYYVHSVF